MIHSGMSYWSVCWIARIDADAFAELYNPKLPLLKKLGIAGCNLEDNLFSKEEQEQNMTDLK